MKQLIIYDLDGTLADTRKDIVCAMNHMLREMRAEPLPAKEIEAYVGRGLHHLVKSCLKTEDPKRIEKGAKIYRTYYGEHMLDHTTLYPGAREVVEYFKSRKQAVITNKPDPFSRDLLKALGVADYFVEIVAGNSEYPQKPHPAAVFSIMKREGAAPEGTLMVGDSRIDIETARNAGVETVAIAHGFTPRDELKSLIPGAVVENFQEFLELAKKKQW